MKTSIHQTPPAPTVFPRLVPLAIALAFATISWAGDPGKETDLDAARSPHDESLRHVLLTNGNVLSGQTSELGDTVYLTREDQSVIRLSRDQVRHVATSMHELYLWRCEDRIETDLRRLHADVRWCLQHGLVREAAEDVLAARKLAPSDPETYQLLRLVSARLKADVQPSETTAKNGTATRDANDQRVRPVSFEMPAGNEDAMAAAESKANPPTVPGRPEEVSEAAFIQFANRVQPILMNRCVRCHAKDAGNDREFQIHTALTSKWNPENVAEENLRHVLRFIDLNAPLQSPLRTWASDGHGGRRHSLGREGSIMMKQLDQWLEKLAADPSATNFPTQVAPWPATTVNRAAPLASTTPPKLTVPAWNPVASSRLEAAPADTRQNDPTVRREVGNRPEMRRMPKVDNPFDPEIFNRRYHRR